ncbi:MAG: hypothetical protein QOD74_1834 [Variibacter sp.]|jgi:hypothetical protein|nr:hypothetical protein [Variibacter sp.]
MRTRTAPTYSQGGLCRLSRGLALLVLFGFALSAGGCSTTYHLGALFGGKEEPERTASTVASVTPAVAHLPLDADLARARAAAEALLVNGVSDSGVPWEDPATGARGTVSPLAAAYTADGSSCQNFLASYVLEGRESWYQGGACQNGNRWQVREFKPLHRTST